MAKTTKKKSTPKKKVTPKAKVAPKATKTVKKVKSVAKATDKPPIKSAKKEAKKVAPKKSLLDKPTTKTPLKAVKKAIKKASKAPVNKAPIKKTVPNKPVSTAPKTATQKLADAAVEGILELKGKNITVMNLQSIHNRVCDYFIICQADSNTQVNAIAESIVETVKKITGDRPYKSEGFENAEWILMDYVTVVVHIFQSHIREFYNLESLWADAETTEIAFD